MSVHNKQYTLYHDNVYIVVFSFLRVICTKLRSASIRVKYALQ